MLEAWKSLVGYEDCYEISSIGNVRRTRYDSSFYNGRKPKQLKWITNGHAYPKIGLTYKGVPKQLYIHVLVAETFLGPKPEGMVVDHIDNNKMNPRADNLRYITRVENVRKYTDTLERVQYKEAIYTPNPHGVTDEVEVWKNIVEKDFVGVYRVSNWGKVERHPDHAVASAKAGPLKHAIDKDGYPRVMLVKAPNKPRLSPVHKLVMEAFVGPRPEGAVINHRDSNKLNCKVSNLEYITQGDNRKHAVDSGLLSKYICYKLDEDKVRSIKQRYASGETQTSLAETFGVTAPTISAIVNGKTWQNV